MKLNKYIDLTNLTATATSDDIKNTCQLAIKYQVAAVCINSSYVTYAKSLLKNINVKVCTVVGFPLGANTTFSKVAEAQLSIDNGADEIDMVIHLGKVKEGDWSYINSELELMRLVVKNCVLKVIVETALLTDDEIIKLIALCEDNGIDYIKTSTGFEGGASVAIVQLIKKHIKGSLKIKASGKITTSAAAVRLIEAGAERIGTSKIEVLTNGS